MASEKTGSGSGEPGGDRDVYKPGRGPITERAHRNMTELMVGVSGAMAEAARTFSDTLRERSQGESRPTDVVEAGALSASRMFAALAESWHGFYDNLVRDHRAAQAPEPIDYDRLADLVVAKLKAADKPGDKPDPKG